MSALAANALTTLDAVLDELGEKRGDRQRDNRIRRAINEVSDFAAGYCRRPLHAGSETQTLRGFGGTDLVLHRRPVVSVASVTIDDEAVTDWTLEPLVPGVPGLLYRRAGWPWTVAFAAGIVLSPIAGSEEPTIAVTYTGGFVTPHQVDLGLYATRTLPYDLEGLAIRLAAVAVNNVGADPRVKSEEVMSASVTYRDDAVPPEVAVVLDRYRSFAG